VAEYGPEHTGQFPDFYHATEDLWTLAHAVRGEGSSHAVARVEAHKTRLCEGRLDDFFGALRRWTEPEPYRSDPHPAEAPRVDTCGAPW